MPGMTTARPSGKALASGAGSPASSSRAPATTRTGTASPATSPRGERRVLRPHQRRQRETVLFLVVGELAEAFQQRRFDALGVAGFHRPRPSDCRRPRAARTASRPRRPASASRNAPAPSAPPSAPAARPSRSRGYARAGSRDGPSASGYRRRGPRGRRAPDRAALALSPCPRQSSATARMRRRSKAPYQPSRRQFSVRFDAKPCTRIIGRPSPGLAMSS